METHEYRGYEITIDVERLASGRFLTELHIVPKARMDGNPFPQMPWLGCKRLHSTSRELAIVRTLLMSKCTIDEIIDRR